jgi:phosphoribosyl 1,2-cyclic phosphodiesterase
MRFASLGSGSRGNATLIEAGGTRVLLDSGFAAREVERRLALLGVEASSLDAILVTHEHQDHIRGVGALARRYQLPVWMTSGTNRCDRCGQLPELHLFSSHSGSFQIGAIKVTPFPIPHDALEPTQFLFTNGTGSLGMLTDAGSWTPHILDLMRSCSAILLECNHDSDMLANGPYPLSLQRRVGGKLGHLSNQQAAEFIGQLDHDSLQHLVAAHLSEQNNTQELVRESLLAAVPALADRLSFALQDGVSSWFEVTV